MIINQLIHCLRTLARLLSIESNRDSLSFVIRVARIHSNAVKGQLIPRGNHFFDDYTFACSSLSLSLLFLFIFFLFDIYVTYRAKLFSYTICTATSTRNYITTNCLLSLSCLQFNIHRDVKKCLLVPDSINAPFTFDKYEAHSNRGEN